MQDTSGLQWPTDVTMWIAALRDAGHVEWMPLYYRKDSVQVCARGRSSGRHSQKHLVNGAIVDTGSKEIALHSDECTVCGGQSHASIQHVVTSLEDDTEQSMKHLGDGVEYSWRVCHDLEIWKGSSWVSLEHFTKQRCHANGDSRCRRCPGQKFLVDIVYDRAPRQGMEIVSTLRSGRFGVGPGCEHVHSDSSVVLLLSKEASVPSDRTEQCVTESKACQGAMCLNMPRTLLPQLKGFVALQTENQSLVRGVGPDTYRVRVRRVLCRVAHDVDRSCAASPDIAVFDTGSTYSYVSPSLFHCLQQNRRKHQGSEIAFDICCTPASDHVKAFRQSFLIQATLYDETTGTGDLRAFPAQLRFPDHLCIIGVKSMRGLALAFVPGCSFKRITPCVYACHMSS